jgi:hypothetical protein
MGVLVLQPSGRMAARMALAAIWPGGVGRQKKKQTLLNCKQVLRGRCSSKKKIPLPPVGWATGCSISNKTKCRALLEIIHFQCVRLKNIEAWTCVLQIPKKGEEARAGFG